MFDISWETFANWILYTFSVVESVPDEYLNSQPGKGFTVCEQCDIATVCAGDRRFQWDGAKGARWGDSLAEREMIVYMIWRG